MMSTLDIEVGARNIAMEARGEPVDGQQAVAWSMRNRLATGRWGASISSVCLWHAAYSGWWCPRGKPSYRDPNFAYATGLRDDDPVLVKMREILTGVMAADQASDITQGSTHYFSTSMSSPPDWVEGATFTVQIGKHRFFKGVA